jgi:sec-independent protein translocase protein TatA
MAPSIAATKFMFTGFAFLTPGPTQMVVVGLVVLLLIGNRLPSVMRSLGEGITEFKKGIKGGESDPNANIEDQSKEN